MDDDYRLINKDALLLITKATELFVTDLAGTCGKIAKQQGRKTMQLQDILNASKFIDKFHFIHSSKLPSLNPNQSNLDLNPQQNQQQKEADEADLKELENLSLDDDEAEAVMNQD